MNRILLFLFATILIQSGRSQFYPSDNGSKVEFKIRNLGFPVSGSFTGLDGKILFDPQKPAEATFDVTVDANSVNTGIDMRDNHLRDDAYFDVKHFPRIRLVSTRIASSSKKGVYIFFGNLTIKNQTRVISFPFTAETQGGSGGLGVGGGYLFKGSFKISRKDYDVGGTSTISNELEVSLLVSTK